MILSSAAARPACTEPQRSLQGPPVATIQAIIVRLIEKVDAEELHHRGCTIILAIRPLTLSPRMTFWGDFELSYCGSSLPVMASRLRLLFKGPLAKEQSIPQTKLALSLSYHMKQSLDNFALFHPATFACYTYNEAHIQSLTR